MKECEDDFDYVGDYLICNAAPNYDLTDFWALDFVVNPWSQEIGNGNFEAAHAECAQHCRENPDCRFFHINYIDAGNNGVGSDFRGKFDGRLIEAWEAVGKQSHTCFLHSECDEPTGYWYTYGLFERRCTGKFQT